MKRTPLLSTACLVALAAAAAPALAGWTVADLNPNGATSWAYGVWAGQVVGAANWSGRQYAGFWGATAATWTPVAYGSQFEGTSGGQQVGWTISASSELYASLWSGTAGSLVNLNPTGATGSWGWGVSGEQQVGSANIDGTTYASLWTGSAASWINLNPAGATASTACGVSGGQQVGSAVINGTWQAGLWNGTASSWVDLSLYGATSSEALATSGSQQVGVVNGEASLWSGTAGSWVNLNPYGAGGSRADAISGNLAAGSAYYYADGYWHAGLWSISTFGTGQGSQTTASWLDLNALLPSGEYAGSMANGIYTFDGNTWVVGQAYDVSTSQWHAILWEDTVPEPPSLLALGCPLLGLAGLAIRRRGRNR